MQRIAVGAGVLGDDGVAGDVRDHVDVAAAGFRQRREFLQHHPQLCLHRHHGAGHDDGRRHRRHRSVGGLGDGTRRHRRRPGAAGRGAVVAGDGRRACHRPRRRRGQRRADRLAGPAAVRGDARHAVDRPFARRRAVAEQDDLRLRPRRRHHLRDRRRTDAGHRQPRVGAARPDRGVLGRAASHALGPASIRHRRQRAGGVADRRAGRAGEARGLHRLGD